MVESLSRGRCIHPPILYPCNEINGCSTVCSLGLDALVPLHKRLWQMRSDSYLEGEICHRLQRWVSSWMGKRAPG